MSVLPVDQPYYDFVSILPKFLGMEGSGLKSQSVSYVVSVIDHKIAVIRIRFFIGTITIVVVTRTLDKSSGWVAICLPPLDRSNILWSSTGTR
jgi:hypothetical protein